VGRAVADGVASSKAFALQIARRALVAGDYHPFGNFVHVVGGAPTFYEGGAAAAALFRGLTDLTIGDHGLKDAYAPALAACFGEPPPRFRDFSRVARPKAKLRMFPIEISLYENQRRLTPFGSYDAANLMPRAMGDPAAYARDGAGNGCPTSKAPLSADFHSFRLMFGRALSKPGCFLWSARAQNAHVEATRFPPRRRSASSGGASTLAKCWRPSTTPSRSSGRATSTTTRTRRSSRPDPGVPARPTRPEPRKRRPRWIDHDGPGDVDGWVYARDYKTEMMRWYEAHCDSKMLDAWASPATAGAATHLFRQRKLTRTARMKRQFHVSPFALVGR